jgi:hypothetical protein
MMGLAMLTAAPVGAVGQLAGLEVVVPTLGWTTLAIILAIVFLRPQVRMIDGGIARPVPAPAAAPFLPAE